MEEDDDAFLYGGDDENQAGTVQESAAATQEASVTEATGKLAVVEGGEAKAEAEEQEEDEDDDDEEEDEDSDSDLEIIVDGSAGPPAGYNARQPIQPVRPTPVQQRAPPSVITSDYTPNARPGQAPSASALAALTGLNAASGEQSASAAASNKAAQLNNLMTISMSDLPEGPPPPVPMTAPRLDLDPSDQALMLPPETVEDEPGPLIYHIDPTELEEKPWRRPGADLTDWFNYGFNEDSWKLWGEKKHGRTMERIDMETNGGRRDNVNENREEEQHEQYNDNGQSNFAPQMPQQLQAMQAMMGASGPAMTPEQMMAFMGMGPGSMPGMGMMGMPGMAAMFGQQNNNPGMFSNGFNGMPNMQMMQQQQQPFNHSQIGDGSLMRFASNNPEQSSGSVKAEESSRDDFNENPDHHATNGETRYTPEPADDSSDRQVKQIHQAAPMEKAASATGSEVASNAGNDTSNIQKGASSAGTQGGMSIRGAGAAPTGPPPKGASIPKGPSTDRGGNAANNLPTGPKNPGRRYNDRDSGAGQADALDYGASMGGGHHREDSAGQQQRGGRDAARRRQRSTESRDVSTDRDREREYEYEYRRDQDRDQGGGVGDRDDRNNASSTRRSNRDQRGNERKRYSSPEEESGGGTSRRERRGEGDRKTSHTSQRLGSSRRGGEHRDEFERDDEWDRESIESSASRRRTASTRSTQQSQPSGRSAARSERRRGGGGGEADSGSETERERKHGRSQMRSERRAGRENPQEKAASGASTSTRKRGAPEDDLSPVRSTTSRKRR